MRLEGFMDKAGEVGIWELDVLCGLKTRLMLVFQASECLFDPPIMTLLLCLN